MTKKDQKEDWKLYEETIVEHFQEVYPELDVKGNQKIVGIKTKRKRQIDVLISGEFAGFPVRIVIDCKHFSRKVDVKIVESFLGMLDDLKADKGVIITNVGYTEAALERAKFDSRNISLDILDFEDLPTFKGTSDAFPSRWNDKERMAIVFSCPFGWQIHPTPPVPGASAGLTKKGVTWEDGWKSKECIYMHLISKREFPQLEDIFALHESSSLKFDPKVEFDYFEDYDDRFTNPFCDKIVLRTGYYSVYPETEATVFLDFGTFYAYFVLTSPVKNRDRNLNKLAFITRTAIPFDLPQKSEVLPFEYMKFHFVENLFQDNKEKTRDSKRKKN